MHRRRAFTLVELLVVISIIGLISTIAVVSLNSARVQARNTKRIADIGQLITAFSIGLDANGAYPAVGASCVSASCYNGYSGYTLNTTVDNFFTPYMSKPVDPADNSRGYGGYIYNGTFAGGSGYDGVFPAGPVVDFTLEPTPSGLDPVY